MRAQHHRFSLPHGNRTTIEALFTRVSALAQQKAELEKTARQLRCEIRRLEQLVYLDPLTGLGNRRHFDTVVADELSRALRTERPLTLLMCDIDHFKGCNDLYGHEAGDSVLVAIGQLLKQFCRRGGDLAARYAGDEFALLLPGAGIDSARRLADRLRVAAGSLSIRHRFGTVRDCVTLSIGGTIFRAPEPCAPDRLVAAADAALYEAKRAGRNRIEFASCG